MPKQTFEQDLSQEEIMAKYLDDHLYNSGIFERHDRTPEQLEQNKGCDIILSSKYWGVNNCLVDEKSQLTYFNKDQATFAFELYYRKRESDGKYTEHTGWFIDKNKETEAFLLVWPFSSASDKEGKIDDLCYEDIAGVRYLLVQKDKIKKYLKNKSLTDLSLLKTAKELFNGNIKTEKNRYKIKDYENDVYYTMSPYLDERPVNLIIKRDILWLLADMRGDIIGNTSACKLKSYW